jgi:GGDEF domain-containing protein
MKVFDHISPEEIDRRQLHLHVLAITLIFILAVGMALMMYPTIFAKPMTLDGGTFRTVFFGFCALSVLTIGYLVDRQVLISKLRVRVAARERAIQIMKQESNKDFLASLPTVETFTDRLFMEFRRVSGVEQPLSLLAVDVKIRPEICHVNETTEVHADAGRAILRRMRGEDSLFLIDSGVFGILLPRIPRHMAELTKAGLEEELCIAAGAIPRFDFRVRLINYPDQANSAHEMVVAIHPTFANRQCQPIPRQAALPVS